MTDHATPTADTLRSIDLTRVSPGRYRATNRRGGELTVGTGDGEDFTPVELLLVALAGCGAIDVDIITGRRVPADRFDVRAEGHKVSDEQGSHLVDLRLAFDVVFPEGDAGDEARAVLPRTMARTRDRLCTVSRTVAIGTPVAFEEA